MERFEALVREWTHEFVGRQAILAEIGRFDGRLLLVIGPPGIGKTALLARYAQDSRIARHFVLNSDARSGDPAQMFHNLGSQLEAIHGVPFPVPREPTASAYASALADQTGRIEPPPRLVIDGMDEVVPEVLAEILGCLQTLRHATVIASSRPDLESALSFADRLLHLGPLAPDDVRALAARRPDLDGDDLVARSEGNALYLRLMLDEAKPGDSLPTGLTNYFNTLLLKLQPDGYRVAAVVSLAKEPLGQGDLTALAGSWSDLLRKVLMETPDNRYRIFHKGFSDHALAHLPAEVLGTARRSLVAFCRQAEHPYALRWRAWHLLDASRHVEGSFRTELYEAVRDPRCFTAQVQAFPLEPALPMQAIHVAMTAAGEADDAVTMVELMILQLHRYHEIVQESPVVALRRAGLERALQLADLCEPDMQVRWYLLVASAVKEDGDSMTADHIVERILQRASKLQCDGVIRYLLEFLGADRTLWILDFYRRIDVYPEQAVYGWLGHPRRDVAWPEVDSWLQSQGLVPEHGWHRQQYFGLVAQYQPERALRLMTKGDGQDADYKLSIIAAHALTQGNLDVALEAGGRMTDEVDSILAAVRYAVSNRKWAQVIQWIRESTRVELKLRAFAEVSRGAFLDGEIAVSNDARQAVEDVAEEISLSAAGKLSLFEMYRAIGRMDKATVWLDRARTDAGWFEIELVAQSMVHVSPTESVSFLLEALDRLHPDGLHRRGIGYGLEENLIELGAYAEARRLRSVLFPESGPVEFSIARHFINLGQVDRGLRFAPLHAEAAHQFLRVGELEQARQQYEAALRQLSLQPTKEAYRIYEDISGRLMGTPFHDLFLEALDKTQEVLDNLAEDDLHEVRMTRLASLFLSANRFDRSLEVMVKQRRYLGNAENTVLGDFLRHYWNQQRASECLAVIEKFTLWQQTPTFDKSAFGWHKSSSKSRPRKSRPMLGQFRFSNDTDNRARRHVRGFLTSFDFEAALREAKAARAEDLRDDLLRDVALVATRAGEKDVFERIVALLSPKGAANLLLSASNTVEDSETARQSVNRAIQLARTLADVSERLESLSDCLSYMVDAEESGPAEILAGQIASQLGQVDEPEKKVQILTNLAQVQCDLGNQDLADRCFSELQEWVGQVGGERRREDCVSRAVWFLCWNQKFDLAVPLIDLLHDDGAKKLVHNFGEHPLHPRRAEAIGTLAGALAKAGRLDDALSWFSRRPPTPHDFARGELAYGLARWGRERDAWGHFHEERAHQDIVASRIGDGLLDAGQPARALQAFMRVRQGAHLARFAYRLFQANALTELKALMPRCVDSQSVFAVAGVLKLAYPDKAGLIEAVVLAA